MRIVMNDFSEFGRKEIEKAIKLLKAYIEQGTPKHFKDRGVKIALNKSSGYVFLTNEEYQSAMLDEDKLRRWYSCSGCGFEGFKEQLKQQGDECCQDYIKQFD